MATNTQAGKTIKKRLLDKDWSVKKLANVVGHPRPTVSAAIYNPGRFPLVRAKIREALSV